MHSILYFFIDDETTGPAPLCSGMPILCGQRCRTDETRPIVAFEISLWGLRISISEHEFAGEINFVVITVNFLGKTVKRLDERVSKWVRISKSQHFRYIARNTPIRASIGVTTEMCKIDGAMSCRINRLSEPVRVGRSQIPLATRTWGVVQGSVDWVRDVVIGSPPYSGM